MSVAMGAQYSGYETSAGASSPPPPLPAQSQSQSVRSEVDNNDRKDIGVFAQSVIGFKLLGVASLILGFADLLIELVAFLIGCSLSYSFSGIWAGFLFALMNGSLLLRANRAKKDLNFYWTASLLRYSKAALVMHVVDFSLALCGVVLFAPTVLVRTYYGSYLENVVIEQSPTTAEAARSTVILLLITVDVCALKLTNRFESLLFRLQPPSRSSSQLNTQPPQVFAENAAYVA